MRVRRRFRVTGAVQGVGFRPHVYLAARKFALVGWVLNDADGVLIEVQGPVDAVDSFRVALVEAAPPHARVDALRETDIPLGVDVAFEIHESPMGQSGTAGVLPDLATCDACLAEALDPSDRRYRYPFTNCTHCGPRFSIMERLPYDRANTSMSDFRMCDVCLQEYRDPANRRFHAQPNACHECGPQLSLDGERGDDALLAAEDALRRGRIVAVKGLGGFHLMVNALDDDAVRRLRARKGRKRKPFAVMFADVETLARFARPSDLELSAVTSSPAPIVVMPHRGALPEAIAPGSPHVGALLPYTPLHHLLLRDLGLPLVATSGNRGGEPICIEGDDAHTRLGHVADVVLDHNRPIGRPVEDSVQREYAGGMVVLRRGRGLAPAPVASCSADGVFARGADLKNAVAISRGGQIVLGPHVGDLSMDVEVLDTYAAARRDFPRVLGTPVVLEAHDMHPDYLSARELPAHAQPVQHHHAHAAACLAEHAVDRALAVAWDGTGYGTDGTIWGGEFLDATLYEFERVAHLRQFRLPGGDVAIRRPARQAFALTHELGVELPLDEGELLRAMIEQAVNAPVTSSAGRLFDAVSWLLGLAAPEISYEGEAAIALEHAAREGSVDLPVPICSDGVVDWGPLVTAVIATSEAVPAIAFAFHQALAKAIAGTVAPTRPEHVALVGGCFQNRLLLELTIKEVEKLGRIPIWCREVPPNDGGIAAGQVAIAAANFRRS